MMREEDPGLAMVRWFSLVAAPCSRGPWERLPVAVNGAHQGVRVQCAGVEEGVAWLPTALPWGSQPGEKAMEMVQRSFGDEEGRGSRMLWCLMEEGGGSCC